MFYQINIYLLPAIPRCRCPEPKFPVFNHFFGHFKVLKYFLTTLCVSNNCIPMYRALYDYLSSLPDYLSFEAGDQFTILDSSHKDWFLAQNGFGEIGYIPRNYVAVDNVRYLHK
jgi:hypothetical protein